MKHEFKAGDRVRIRKWGDMAREYSKRTNQGSIVFDSEIAAFGEYMKHLCGRTATIKEIYKRGGVELTDWCSTEGDVYWHYCDEMLEPANENGGKEMKQFTKADLRNGDVIVKRCGNVEIVCIETGALICSGSGYNALENIRADLTCDRASDGSFDVVKIYRPTKPCECSFGYYQGGTLVYDRDAPIKMTLAEIEEKLGHKVEIVGDK